VVTFQPRDLMHPLDRSARSALESVPLLQTAVAAWGRLAGDRTSKSFLLANAIRLGPRQLPEFYRMLPPVCDALGIRVPELYLMTGPANAMTVAPGEPAIVLFSGLLENLDLDEIEAVIAHECGHIMFDHVLYSEMANALTSMTAVLLPKPARLAILPVEEALLNWYRKSELSADRAAAVACRGGADAMKRAIFHMIGVPKWLPGNISIEEFDRQVEEFDAYKSSSLWNKLVNARLQSMAPTHPMPAARIKYLLDWTRSDSFRILEKAVTDQRKIGLRCRQCHSRMDAAWRFCQSCGATAVIAIEGSATPALEGPTL